MGVALALAASLAASRLPARMRAYAVTQLAVQSLLFVTPWIALNVSFQPSLDRYLELTELYRPILPGEVSAGHYETLRTAFANTHNPEGEIAMILRAEELTRDRYEYYKLVRVYEEATSLTPTMLGAAERSIVAIREMPDSVRRLPVGRDRYSAVLTLDDLAADLARAVARLLPVEQRGRWAEQALGPLLDEPARSFELCSYVGYRYHDARDYARALAFMTRAVRDTALAPAAARTSILVLHHALGVAYAHTGREEESLAAFRQAVRYAQAPAAAWSDYGFACYTYSRFAEAVPAFTQALRRDSTDANALYCLGKIYFIDPATHDAGRRLLRLFLARERGTPRAKDAGEIIDLTPEQLRSMTFTK
jgi:tetratricopeptide (TPR) repeat protein